MAKEKLKYDQHNELFNMVHKLKVNSNDNTTTVGFYIDEFPSSHTCDICTSLDQDEEYRIWEAKE